MDFDKWLNEITAGDTDLSLEMDLILEFALIAPDTYMCLREWFDDHDGNTVKLHDIMYTAGANQRVEFKAWIPQREHVEFVEWLKSHPNQNYDYAEEV
jgi:hypothetical protein